MNFFTTYFIYYPVFWLGYLVFRLTGRTPNMSYLFFRKLYCYTNGGINEYVSRMIASSHKPGTRDHAEGILGKLSARDIQYIVGEIRENGFHVFELKADHAICDELIEFAKRTPANIIPNPNKLPMQVFDKNNVAGPRYQFTEQDLFELRATQQLVTDHTLLAVAESYLKSAVVNDSVTMWWSSPFSKKASSAAAQLYHFDMDRFKFIKFFIYLTDVHSGNGPHCYVRGSHTEKPKKLRRDGRIEDEEIAASYPANNLIEITGSKGTIIAVDTSGFHKGKPLENGERLLYQIEYTNSLFGQKFNKVKINSKFTEDFLSKIRSMPYTFSRLVN
ncbi:MAG: phytanoyl-CoA dioxygenase family protein [Cytophagaceae bacterium]